MQPVPCHARHDWSRPVVYDIRVILPIQCLSDIILSQISRQALL
jgi:hypothetical protein